VKTVDAAVVVPVSAVQGAISGTRSLVTVLSAETTSRKLVTIGAVGSRTVQVTEGLTAGDVVVLADVNADVPSSSTATTRRFTGGGFSGATTGGAAPAGGFGGAPPGAP
jgi:hypothetical protein